MAFDINTATPGTAGGFDLESAQPAPQDMSSETYFRNDAARNVKAPSGLLGEEVDFLDDTQNAGAPKGEYFGLTRIAEGAGQVASIIGKGVAATATRIQGTLRAGAEQRVGEAIELGLGVDLDAVRSKAIRGEDLTPEETQVFLKNVSDTNNPFSFLFRRPEDMALIEAQQADEPEEIAELSVKSEAFINSAEKIKASTDEIIKKNFSLPEEATTGERLLFDVSGGATTLAASLGLALVTRNPAASTVLFAELQKNDIYMEAREKGIDTLSADKASDLAAIVEGGLEAFGVDRFLKVIRNSKGVARVVKNAVQEGIQEFSQTTGEEIVTQATGIREPDAQRALEDAAYSGLIGFITGGGSSAIVNAVESVSGENKKVAQSVLNKVQEKLPEIVDETANSLETVASPIYNSEVEAEAAAAVKVMEDFASGRDVDISGLSEAEQSFLRDDVPILDQTKNTLAVDNIPITLFHSTTSEADFDTFDLTRSGTATDQGNLGVGVYLTPFRSIAAGTTKGQGRLIETEAFLENPIEIVRDNNFKQNIADAAKAIGVQAEPKFSGTKQISKEFAEEFTQKAIAAGHDGAIVRAPNEAADLAEVVVYDPQNVTIKDKGFEIKEDAAPETVRQNIELQKILEGKRRSAISQSTENALDALNKGVENILVPISTRLKRVTPKLKAQLRKFEGKLLKAVKDDSDAITPYLEKLTKLSRDEKTALDFAMMNGDKELVDTIAERNDLSEELKTVRSTLDSIYGRAKSVGVDVGYLENFFPRVIKNHKKFVEHFERSEVGDLITEAIALKEQEVARVLTMEEKSHLINTLLRGYETAQITLSKPGALKERNIDTVNEEIFDFYATSEQALLQYITSVNENIEARKFFGKSTNSQDIEDSIGAYVLKEMQDGNITPSQMAEVSDVLKARFSKGSMNAIVRIYKNFSYIDTMGSPTSAITQIGDLAFSMFDSGMYNTSVALRKAITGKSEITVDDVGVERMAQEFEGYSLSSKAVQEVFKLVGLQKMDRIGKETLMNSALLRHRKAAKTPTDEYRQSLELFFEGETDQVIQDLQDGVNSENVRLLVLNDLMEFQPIALSEMPVSYLNARNGRIFYMLKTFTVKQFDIYRNRVFDEIREGNTKKGLAQLAQLSFFFVAMNGTADLLKDLLMGRETEPEDMVVNNILRLFGISKYTTYQARKEGIGTATAKLILPPFKFIDNLYKDMAKAIDKGKVDVDNFNTIKSIPIVGKLYYWWFGAGAEKTSGGKRKRSAKGFEL